MSASRNLFAQMAHMLTVLQVSYAELSCINVLEWSTHWHHYWNSVKHMQCRWGIYPEKSILNIKWTGRNSSVGCWGTIRKRNLHTRSRRGVLRRRQMWWFIWIHPWEVDVLLWQVELWMAALFFHVRSCSFGKAQNKSLDLRHKPACMVWVFTGGRIEKS